MSTWDTLLPALVKEFNEHPNDFLRQTAFRFALHPNQQKVADAYFPTLMRSAWVNVSRLRDPARGKPFQYEKYKQCSPLSIQHAYYLHLIGEAFGDWWHFMVSEIGGGYGNMRRVANDMGHITSYIIFDFKQMHEIQRQCLGGLYTGYITLTPTKLRQAGAPASLLIATFSVSEMPMQQRLKLEQAYSAYDHMFFAYNREFDGVDNFKYFAELGERLELTGYKVKFIEDPPRRARFMLAERA
jgi:hypothetical protein